MKIELNYTNNELTTLLNGLNNAILCLMRNYNAIHLGCEDGVPKELLQLNVPFEELQFRFNAVKDLYNYLLTYENS